MLRIGLTGGIGAGKSALSSTFAKCGAVVVDGDVIAREVVQPGTDGLAALVEAFGSDILLPDGSLDRPALAAKAFRDDEAAQDAERDRPSLGGQSPFGDHRLGARGCRRGRGHSAAGGIRYGGAVSARRHRVRRCRGAAAAPGRPARHGRRRRPRQDRGAGQRRAAPRGRRHLAGQLGQPRGVGRSRPRTCGTTGSFRSRTTSARARSPGPRLDWCRPTRVGRTRRNES